MRKQCLTIGLILIALSLCLAYSAYADTVGKASAIVTTGGAGFKPGYGITGSYLWRTDHFGVQGSGSFLSKAKKGADWGVTYGALIEARGYLGNWYLGAGPAFSGYHSEFDNGSTWAKSAWQAAASAGYTGKLFSVGVRYLFKEHQTPNEVSAIQFGYDVAVWRGLLLSVGITNQSYYQSGKRENSTSATFGLGWRF